MAMPSRFLTAEWRWLAMLNFPVDPSALRPHVPRGTELDPWNGHTYVSMVGFRFLRTRVAGWAIPFHENFDEVNLRFYVRRKAPDGWRRGVVFIKEIVPRFAIAAIARGLYHENYVSLPMRHRIDAGRAEYRWKHAGKWSHLAVEIAGDSALPAAGSDEEFITEHYWGYSAQPDGGTVEYRVEHPRWWTWRSERAELHCAAAALYGPEFAEALSAPPHSAFVAEGSQIAVYRGTRLPAGPE